jgi:hypothetical protein
MCFIFLLENKEWESILKDMDTDYKYKFNFPTIKLQVK